MLPESLQHACRWLQDLPLSQDIRESQWLFPIIETIHVLALVLVVGSISMVDLRLLGLRGRERAFSKIAGEMLPWTWCAFAFAAVAGLLMFCSKAAAYAANVPFQLKVLCLGLAAVNMLIFHSLSDKRIAEWDMGTPPTRAKIAGAVSLMLWFTIVAAGRWIGFTVR
jgi:hypothetical protein